MNRNGIPDPCEADARGPHEKCHAGCCVAVALRPRLRLQNNNWTKGREEKGGEALGLVMVGVFGTEMACWLGSLVKRLVPASLNVSKLFLEESLTLNKTKYGPKHSMRAISAWMHNLN